MANRRPLDREREEGPQSLFNDKWGWGVQVCTRDTPNLSEGELEGIH